MSKNHNGKLIFNKATISWSGFNFDNKFVDYLVKQKIPFLELSQLDYNSFSSDLPKVSNLEEVYKDIKLYNVCIYSICNDLIIFRDELDLKKHSAVIDKWYFFARKTIDYLHEIIVKNQVSGAIIFHGHLLFDACLLSLCKNYGIKFISFETTSNKERIIWDNVSGFVVTYNLAKNFFHGYSKSLNKQIVDNYCNSYLKNILSFKREEHLSIDVERAIPFKKNYILFVCQVYNDASLLFTLDNEFKNPIDVIENVQGIAETLNKNVIIKIHPKEVKGSDPVNKQSYGQPTVTRLSEIANKKNVFIDENNEYDIFKLIDNCNFVITVNSQAGLEACIWNKPVLNFYKCFYSCLGFTYDYSSVESLKFNMESLIRNNITECKNLNWAKSFFYVYYEIYCLKRSHIEVLKKIQDYFEIRFLKDKSFLNKLLNIK